MSSHSISSGKSPFQIRWFYLAGLLLIGLSTLWIWSLIEDGLLMTQNEVGDLPIVHEDGSTNHELSDSVIIRLSALDVHEHLEADEDTILLDVRDPEQYADRHIPGAISMPLATLDDRADELDPDSEIILVCANGQLSLQAARMLLDLGFNKVFTLDGGMDAWSRADLHLCTEC
jgi:rhodanese-related sulfurtransferase